MGPLVLLNFLFHFEYLYYTTTIPFLLCIFFYRITFFVYLDEGIFLPVTKLGDDRQTLEMAS